MRLHPRHPVDAEQEAPDRVRRLRRNAHRLDRQSMADPAAMLECRVDAIERVSRRRAADVEHRALQCAAAATLPVLIDQQPVLPPGGGAREHARRLTRDAIVDRGHERLGLGERNKACTPLRVACSVSRRMFARQVDLGHHRCHAAAEPPIDRVLRGPEDQHRLAARMRRIDLRAHHRAQQAAAAVRRQHADDREARSLHLPARHREIECEYARPGDRAVTLEGRMHAIRRQNPFKGASRPRRSAGSVRNSARSARTPRASRPRSHTAAPA